MRREKSSNSETEIIEAPEGISVKEAGRRGGLSTSARYRDTGFYQRIGAKGGKRQKELYADLLAEFGKRGGRPRRPDLNSMGREFPEKKGGRSAPGNSLPT